MTYDQKLAQLRDETRHMAMTCLHREHDALAAVLMRVCVVIQETREEARKYNLSDEVFT